MKDEFFKISSGLKTLIGSELITDNFVAVFELVKNSFDANANEVKIRFEKINSVEGKIIIQDNGKGMDYNDLINKWLFVAYSAKRDGTEDKESDYRNKLKSERFYAGAKGVGRFSCDRLGRFLKLISIKDKAGAKIESLEVDWHKFEEDQKKEFITIPVKHTVLKKAPYNLKKGTILEISGIEPEEWNRESFKKLKDKLSKLVRPDLNKTVKEKRFKILLQVPEEQHNDDLEIEKGKKRNESEGYYYYNTVNGEIKNFIFDELIIRTTKIVSFVSPDSKFITTKLSDRDLFIYEIKEHNKYNLLKNVSVTLYFLNQSAKTLFSKKMGIQPVEYGNLFVYKNGFRIYPYGERGDDSLGIDNRAVQGYNRFIGLRNLIGQIDIQGDNFQLREATSRDAGMVKSKAYYQLADASPFADSLLLTTLRRLEKYVVEVTQWGINDENYEINNSNAAKESLVKLITNIYDDKTLIEVNYNKNIIDILDQKEQKSAKKLLANFKRVAAESNDLQLVKDAKKLEKRINQQAKALESAKKEIEVKENLGRETEKKLELIVSQKNFLQQEIGDDTKNLESILHHIGLTTNLIKSDIENLVKAIKNNAPKDQLVDIVKRLSRQNEKITSFSKYFKKVNFNIHSNKLEIDIVSFTNEYLENVYKLRDDLRINRELLSVSLSTPTNLEFKLRLNPIDMIIVLDNLVSNSSKNGASKIMIEWIKHNKTIKMSFRDNGKGISDAVLDNIFDFGFTTSRRGSGIGLYHVKEIVEKIGGTIQVNNKHAKGVEFIFSFKIP